MSSTSTFHQFTCIICGQGFEQMSRLRRHIDTSHPPSAPSAADIEKSLSGIDFPRTKQELVRYASRKQRIIGKNVFYLIKSLPGRTYRDSAEVAIALGELKGGKQIKTSKLVAKSQQPSKKGGKAASKSVSASALAKVLSGINFPKTKAGLMQHARKNLAKASRNSPSILNILNRIANRTYNNMAEVEREAGKLR